MFKIPRFPFLNYCAEIQRSGCLFSGKATMDHIFPFPFHRSKLMRLPTRKYETDAILGPIYLTNVLLYLLSVSSNQLYRSSLEYNLLLRTC